MATETKATTEEAKMDLFEDDDEFEEFEMNEGTSWLTFHAHVGPLLACLRWEPWILGFK